jgi:hypothetical protein
MLMALAAAQIQYAQEVRGYAMLTASVLACALVIVWIETHGSTLARYAALGLTLLLAMGVHYHAAFPLAALMLYSMLRLQNRARLAVATTAIIAAGVYIIVMFPLMREHLANARLSWDWTREAREGHVARTLGRLAGLPLRHLISSQNRGALKWLGLLIFIAPIPFLRKRADLLLWWCMLIATVGAITVADLARAAKMLDFPRYTIAATPAICALVAIAFARRAMLMHALPALLALLCLFNLPGSYVRWNDDYRALGTYLSQHVGEHDIVIFAWDRARPWESSVRYMAFTQYAAHAPRAAALMTDRADEPLMHELAGFEDTWLVEGELAPRWEVLPGCDAVEVKIVPQVARISRMRISARAHAASQSP